MCLEASVVLCPLRKQGRGLLSLLLPITGLLFQLWIKVIVSLWLHWELCIVSPKTGQ